MGPRSNRDIAMTGHQVVTRKRTLAPLTPVNSSDIIAPSRPLLVTSPEPLAVAKPFDHLKDLSRKVLGKGVESAAQEAATERFEDEQALAQRVIKAAGETIDLADQLAADGNPHKQRLAAIIKDSVIGAVEEKQTGRPQAEEARKPIEASPFAVSSKPSGPSLPDSPPTASLPAPTKPKKRGRGRPRKEPEG